MNKPKPFFKTATGILVIVLCTLTIATIICACYLYSSYKSVKDSEDGLPLSIAVDVLKLMIDEENAKHILECEIAIAEALDAAKKDDYPKTHEALEKAVQEISIAAGEKSPIVCCAISFQTNLESHFEQWSVVEKLERNQLKNWPNTKPFARMIAMSRENLANALARQEKYEEALQMRLENVSNSEKTAIGTNHQTLISALNSLAFLYSDFQEYDKAFDAKDRAMILAAKYPDDEEYRSSPQDYLLQEAELKRKAHSFKAARILFDKVISLNPQNAYAYSERGFMLKSDLHDFNGAISDYSKAIDTVEAKYPNKKAKNVYSLYLNHIRRSAAYTETKQYEKALADTTNAIENYFENYANLAYGRRADCYSKMGNLEKALSDFDIAIKTKNQSERAAFVYLRAQARVRAGQNKEAVSDYGKCTKDAPRDPRPYSGRAELSLKQNDAEKAVADYTIAEKNLVYFTPKHSLKDTMTNLPEWKEKMAVAIYSGRAKAYNALRQSKLADADRTKATEYEQLIARALQ